jgi:cell division protein ZapA
VSDPRAVDVTIMGREFRVACAEQEKPALLLAVNYLDKKMREIRDAGKVIGMERLAIMAALNIAHDYLSQHDAGADREATQQRIADMNATLDRALADQDNLF